MFIYLHLYSVITKGLSVSDTRGRLYGNANSGLSCNLLHLHPLIKTTVRLIKQLYVSANQGSVQPLVLSSDFILNLNYSQ